nr:Imm1 family immunity protein [Xanthomonas sp. SI]
MSQDQHQELWYQAAGGQSLCALINGGVGCLMYLREAGDAGFSSRNPDYSGPEDAMIEFILGNGQLDLYPASWTLPLAHVMRAIDYFQSTGLPPPFIAWNNDSDDGSLPGPIT